MIHYIKYLMLIIYFCNEMEKNLVIIPTYNEAENVIIMIEKVFSIHGKKFDILIVDDSSPDGTADLVKKLIINLSISKY